MLETQVLEKIFNTRIFNKKVKRTDYIWIVVLVKFAKCAKLARPLFRLQNPWVYLDS